MIKRKIKNSLRILKRKPTNTIINIWGLSIGLACFVLAFLFIQYKFSFDRFHENSDRIARVIINTSPDAGDRRIALTPAPFAKSVKEMYPEIVKAAAVGGALTRTTKFTYGSKTFHEHQIIYTTEDFFDIFSYDFVGSIPEPLKEPNSIILTETVAKKYFGDTNPIGEVITIRDEIQVKVTAILKDVQQNASMTFEFILPLSMYEIEYNRAVDESWGWNNFYTFLLLDEKVSFKEAQAKVSRQYYVINPEYNKGRLFELQPYNRVYLYSKNILYDFIKDTSGGIDIIYTIGAVAFFVLLLACINFMNMGTAQMDSRAKDIGIRKVFGSSKNKLVRYLMIENLIQSFLAFFLSMVIVEIVHPYFNILMHSSIRIDYLSLRLMGTLILIALITGLLAGIYPSMALSSINPLKALQLEKSNRSKGGFIRKALVVFQFSISAGLIIVVLLVSNQVNHILSKDWGYNRENIISVNVDPRNQELHQSFKSKMLENVYVIGVTANEKMPIRSSGSTDGFHIWEGNDTDESLIMYFNFVDYDFFEIYEMKMVEGRSYSRDFATDLTDAIIVNEAAVEAMKMSDPIGKMVSLWSSDSSFRGHIVGVVEDFNFENARRKIHPLMLKLKPSSSNQIVIKFSPGKENEVKKYIEENWKDFYGDDPLNIRNLDTQFKELYKSEFSTQKIMRVLTVIAVIISCMGLFALVLFTIQKRTKEIGIRKVVGANSFGIAMALIKEYIIFIMIANIIAAPVAYYFIDRYLQNYVYRIDITFVPFVLALCLSLLLAIGTIMIHVHKAASSNPVDALRHE